MHWSEIVHAVLYSRALNAGKVPAPWGAAILVVCVMYVLGWAIATGFLLVGRLRCKHTRPTYFKRIDEASAWWWCPDCVRYFKGAEIEVDIAESESERKASA